MDGEQEKAFLSVVMPEDLKRWVRVAAAQRDMSASAYVRELVVRERGANANAAHSITTHSSSAR